MGRVDDDEEAVRADGAGLQIGGDVDRLDEANLDLAGTAGTLLLAAGMVGLGLGIRLRSLWPLQPRVLLLAALSTLVAAGRRSGSSWRHADVRAATIRR